MERTSYPLNTLHPAITELYPTQEIIYHNGNYSFIVVGIVDETGEYKLQPVDLTGKNIPGAPRLKTNPSNVEIFSYNLTDEL